VPFSPSGAAEAGRLLRKCDDRLTAKRAFGAVEDEMPPWRASIARFVGTVGPRSLARCTDLQVRSATRIDQ
jgi:hypothetical protein